MSGKKIISLRYSLVEMLVVIAVLAIFFGSSLTFFMESGNVCKAYSDIALAQKQASVLKKEWRSFIRGKGLPYVVNEKELLLKTIVQ